MSWLQRIVVFSIGFYAGMIALALGIPSGRWPDDEH